MREILFRGKVLDGSKWIEGYYVYLTHPEGGERFKHQIIQGECGRAVDPDTVGQYTGLKDKTGKKIFEGDVLTASVYPYFDSEDNSRPYVGIVEWIFSGWQVRLRLVDERRRGISDGINQGYLEGNLDEKCFQIIGNIHDESERLEGFDNE